jgi:hypothetical protein
MDSFVFTRHSSEHEPEAYWLRRCARPSPTRPTEPHHPGVRILAALTLLVTAAAASGDIRTDVDPRDLLRALAGFTYAGMGPDWEPSARRLIDLLNGWAADTRE